MIRLEDLKPGMRVSGLLEGQVAEIIQVIPVRKIGRFDNQGDQLLSVKVVYTDGSHHYGDRIVFRRDEATLQEAHESFLFGEMAEIARLGWQARRIESAHLFDPYHEVFASNIEVLPHQIEAVYGTMLRRQPLRFLLADDPGAGKTIMAGLYLREMIARASVKRCLIVAPAGLLEQWRSELQEKLRIRFEPFHKDMLKNDPELRQHDYLIAKMDQLKRREYLKQLQQSEWDLVICDEAHKMSASYAGGDVNRTQRYRLAEMLSGITRHFLLMTATPHNGKEDDFQLFLRLLDEDRFEGNDSPVKSKFINEANSALRRLEVSKNINSRFDYMLSMMASGKTCYESFDSDYNAREEKFNALKELIDKHDDYERRKQRKPDTADVILRRMKEQLVTLDSKPLYPERKAYTANYMLSADERELYEAVTKYCREEFNRADRLESGRKTTVGFALTVLQRRLASSPEAIYQSLRSRLQRLETRLSDAQKSHSKESPAASFENGLFSEEELEDMTAEEREDRENKVSDGASAAETMDELKKEIETLRLLEAQADAVRSSNRDSKWEKLREIWEEHIPEMESNGLQRKLIIFTEHRATLDYLLHKLSELLPGERPVVTIHGGIPQASRRNIQNDFKDNPEAQILVATDAAGEGINLQFAHLMVNYDLPWNPNRLEQRFGRIHRIGQTEVCHLWNIVTTETREGSVYERLLKKLETIGNALNGKVFDILGELFEGDPLPTLLKKALRYGDDPYVRERLNQTIDDAVNHERIRELTQDRVLATDIIDVDRLSADMQTAGKDRLKPSDIRDFLFCAFEHASPGGCNISELGSGYYQISEVPEAIDFHALHHCNIELHQSYKIACFDPAISAASTGFYAPELIDSGHPLLAATINWLTDTHSQLGELATPVLVNRDADIEEHRWLFFLEWEIRNGESESNVIERQARFLEVEDSGYIHEVDASSALAYLPAEKRHEGTISTMLSHVEPLEQCLNDQVVSYAVYHFVDPRRAAIDKRETHRLETEKRQVEERMLAEINYERMQELMYQWREAEQENSPAYRGLRAQAAGRRQELERRLEKRRKQFSQQMQISASGITIRRVAVIVPANLLRN